MRREMHGDDWYSALRAKECKASSDYCWAKDHEESRITPRNADDMNEEQNSLYDEAENEPLSKYEQARKSPKKGRSVNAGREIKLKISNKMFKQGLSSALPSDMYGDAPVRSSLPIVEVPEEEPVPNLNMFKRDANESNFVEYEELQRSKRSIEKNAKKYAIQSHPKVTVDGKVVHGKDPKQIEEVVKEVYEMKAKLDNSVELSNYDELVDESAVIRESRNSK